MALFPLPAFLWLITAEFAGRPLKSTYSTVSALVLGLNYFMRSPLGPWSFSALADNEDLAANLGKPSVKSD